MKVLGAGCCCCTALQAPRKQTHTCLWVCWQPLNRAGLKLHVQHEVVRLCYHRDVGQWRWAELVACLALCLHAAGCCFLLCFECGPASWRLHLAAVCLLTWILLTAGKPAAPLYCRVAAAVPYDLCGFSGGTYSAVSPVATSTIAACIASYEIADMHQHSPGLNRHCRLLLCELLLLLRASPAATKLHACISIDRAWTSFVGCCCASCYYYCCVHRQLLCCMHASALFGPGLVLLAVAVRAPAVSVEACSSLW